MSVVFYNGPRKIFYSLIITLTIIVGCKNNANSDSPAGTKDPLSTFELEKGFKIELIAAEPLISDPVDMEIDEYGRLYVVEMHGYPLDKGGSGKIKLVSDSNADGKMDKSTVFADGLTLPNSIMRWKKGVLVTDAPYVFYFEDTNNDGRAEIKDTMLTGFALSNPQHNLNNPVLGIDNWIYLGHEGAVTTQTYKEEFGDAGTEIYYPDHPASPRLEKNASGRSVRFRPEQHLLETTSSKIVIGAAFYGKIWENVPDTSNGLYQPAKFKSTIHYKKLVSDFTASTGFNYYWDDVAKAPYLYNPIQKLFVTYDDKRSVQTKTQYVIDKKLSGIMFWQLMGDTFKDGLLEAINAVSNPAK
jgi:hypothetical protein